MNNEQLLCHRCVYVCTACAYTTQKQYNLTRHMANKHSNDAPSSPNTNTEIHICHTCGKTFKRNYHLVRHHNTCKGATNPYVCQHCNQSFAHSTNKYRHLKICPAFCEKTNDADTEIDIDVDVDVDPSIITYDSEMALLNDHIGPDIVLKWLGSYDHELTMRTYSSYIMDRAENQFIKKTNLRSSTSEVHIGNNRWEVKLDSQLYPEVMCNISNGFGTLINDYVHDNDDERFKSILFDRSRRQMYTKLDEFIDYMATNGYCNDMNEMKVKRIKRCFDTLVRELRLLVFNYTRKT